MKVSTEVDFRQIFGGPTDENYEYWYTVDNFLEYGGQCYVIRCDDAQGDYIDRSIEYTEGGNNITSNIRHPQKMRNATDAFSYYPTNFDEPTQSDVYLKNDDEFDSYNGAVIPNYGSFFARNPGTWMNGVGVAVIDSGADYQMTLAEGNPALNVDALLIVNGGTANQEYTDVLAGGDAAQADIDPLLDVNLADDYRTFDPPRS